MGQESSTNLPLMPWPSSVSSVPGSTPAGSIPIDGSFSISVTGSGRKDSRVQSAVERTFARLTRQTGIPILLRVVEQNGTLTIVVERGDHRGPQKLGDDERYSLKASDGKVRLSANEPLGVLRGLETFLQLVQQNTTGAPGFSVPAVTIQDQPRFPWRGLSLDVSRHFIPAENVRRIIDGLCAVKMNVLHWHLSDDQGFRVESKKYPRLQKYGSDGLYYAQAEVRDVIAYARDRGVRIVPEFDMPGHATSWLVGYPSLGAGAGNYQIVRGAGVLPDLIDPTKESTYKFLDGFIGEMSKLFPDEYFHIGGDEVNPKQWNENPRIQTFLRKHHIADAKALQVYFNQRLLKIVTKHGKRMEGWDEVLQPSLPKNIVIQSWRGQESLWQAAREGYQGILSAGYYLDLMYPASYHYSIDPMKTPPPAPGREGQAQTPAPAPDLTPEQRKLILGGEAAMWEELATSENIDAKLWPRLAAIAERFWSPETVTDPTSMYRRLEITNSWLEWLGLSQRSNLTLMRQRLAGEMPAQPLDTFASILEPVKGYSRHAERYNLLTPFNRLVDAIPPESDAARQFRESVDRYVAGPKGSESSATLRRQLLQWLENARAIRPMLQGNSLLNEDAPVADEMIGLCQAGLDAITALDIGQSSGARTAIAAEPRADMLIQIAPGIQKLIEAAPTGSH